MGPKGLANTSCPGVHGYSLTTVCQNIDILTIFFFGDGRFKVKEEYGSVPQPICEINFVNCQESLKLHKKKKKEYGSVRRTRRSGHILDRRKGGFQGKGAFL